MELTMRPLIVSALCRKHTYSKLYLPQYRTLTVYFWPCLQCTISRICLRYNVFVQTKLNCIYYLSITHMVLYTHYKASKHQVSTFSLLNIPLLVCKRVCLRFFFSLIFVCYGGLKLLVKLLFSIFRNVWQFVFSQFVCTSLFIFDSRKTQTNKPEAFRKRKTTNIYAFHVNRTPLLPFLLNPILDFGNVYCTSSTVDVYFLPVAEHFIRIRRWIYF